MQLRRLLAAVPNALLTGSFDVEIRDVAYDSRTIEPGSLFTAVPRVGGDGYSGGYQHIAQAIRQGAVAVVAQAPCTIPVDVPLAVVPDTRAALADLSGEFFGHPSRELSVFAVTGTDGKTTTTYLLDGILSAAGFRTGLIGTVETRIGDQRTFNADRVTTPESLDTQRLLRAMVDAGVTHVSLEASSHALALQRLRGISFTACAVTNITADHVEFHGAWDAYFAAKASLFTKLAPDRPAILNRDDGSYERLASMIDGPVMTYGLTSDADIWSSDIEPGRSSTRFNLQKGSSHAHTSVPLSGEFNISNALAAAGLALSSGLPIETVALGLTHATPPPGRMQHIVSGQDFDVLVDYAHTPNAFESVLSGLRTMAHEHHLIAVFGAAGDRDRSKRPLLARIAMAYTDYFFITNEDPFGEQPASIIAEVAAGADPADRGRRYTIEPDRTRAIRGAIEHAGPGDIVVILGKGHEQSIVVDGRKQPWSDSRAAHEALEALR